MPPPQPATHVDDPVRVGRRLRDARAAAGLSRRRLAFPGCTAAQISGFEAGRRIPTLEELRRLGDRLGVSADWLATGAEPPGLAGDPLDEAEVSLRLGDPEHARAIFERLLLEETEPGRRARALAGLGQTAFARGEHSDAIELFEEALALSPTLETADPGLADSLGRAYAMRSRYEEAIAVFQRRLEAAQRGRDAVQTVRFALLLANALVDRGAYDRATRVLAHAVRTARELDDPLVHAQLAWSQSRLHAAQKDAATAERFARLALETLERTEHVRYAALAHQVLAHIELDRGAADEALELLERGLPLVRAGGNAYEAGLFDVERARALVQLGLYEDAHGLAAAAAAALADGSPVDAGRAHLLLAEIHRQLDDDEQAIRAYRQAIDVLPVVDRYKLEAYRGLARLLRDRGRVTEALELLDAALQARGSSPG